VTWWGCPGVMVPEAPLGVIRRATVVGAATSEADGEQAAEDWSRRVDGPSGVMHAVWFSRFVRNYVEADLALFRRFGDVVRVRVPYRAHLFFRPRHVRQVLRTRVLNHPKSADYDMLKPILGDGIFVSEGELWTRQRRLLAPEFRENVVGRFVPMMVECAEKLFAEWDARLAKGPIDVGADMMRLTLWIVGRTMFKSEFLKEAELIGHALEVCLAHATTQMLSGGLYKSWLPTPGNRRARAAEKQLDDVVMSIIARGRAGDLGKDDVLSRMIRAGNAEAGARMDDKQLLDEIKSLMLAGHETTSLALSWGFYLLARHPAAAARLAEEARATLGDGTPEARHLPMLAFSRMVFLETMRIYPPVPSVPRAVVSEEEIDGVRVRPGERVYIVPYVTHRHPEYWREPERFEPERFAPERADRITPYSYMPFLLGRRACLGESFAMIEGVLLLSMIARRYRLTLVSDAPIPTRPISTLRLGRPLMMRVERR
jgi:cytochrome P450